jgi:sigma-B regulation protein RsbU (phosphoserine phosphatase)
MYPYLSKYDKIENELKLKQLQIKSLLSITQAINENIAVSELYNMYNTFLSWDMGVGKMALFTENEKEWKCVSQIGIDYQLNDQDIIDLMLVYKRTSPIKEEDKLKLPDFDVVIPVYHKKQPIAFAFIGEIRDSDGDVYDQIQFINTITNIVAVAIENKRLFKEQLEQERYKRSLELAAEMQRKLMPDKLPSGQFIQFDYFYKPHFNVGGDYLDVFKIDDRYVFCIADVSGKGVAAAILMANFQALLRSMVDKYNELSKLITALNEAVYRITRGDKFISFFIGSINTKSNLLEYINSGHNSPLLCNSEKFLWLDKGCPVLGVIPQIPSIQIGMEFLHQDSLIFCYTDGITEYKEENGQFLGQEFILDFATDNGVIRPDIFNRKFLDRIKNIGGDEKFFDDIALLTLKYSKTSCQ